LLVIVLTASVSLAQSSQTVSPQLAQRIERAVRAFANIPSTVPVSVGDRKAGSDFPGYDSITVLVPQQSGNKPFQFLISKDDRKLLYVSSMDLTTDPYEATMKKIDLSGRPMKGNPNAKVTVVVYDDFECPFCAKAHQILFGEIYPEYKDRIRIIYKDFPLVDAHPWAMRAAVDANCLAGQSNEAFWGFADYVHSHLGELNQGYAEAKREASARTGANASGGAYGAIDEAARNEAQSLHLDPQIMNSCMAADYTAPVKASIDEGSSLGVSATPAIFINGEVLFGVTNAQELRSILDKDLEPPAAAAASLR
jgi:protein-disulfide isomerase